MPEIADIDDIPADLRDELSRLGIETCAELARRSPNHLAAKISTNNDIDDLRRYIGLAQDITSDELGAFTTGHEVERGTDLSGVDIPESVVGWNLNKKTPDEVRWNTPSGYYIRIHGNQMSVKGHVPATEGDENNIHQKVTTRIISQHPDDSPQDAVQSAVEWLEDHPLPELETPELDGIGHRTAEFLWFKHGIEDEADLRRAVTENNLTLSDFVQDKYVETILNTVR